MGLQKKRLLLEMHFRELGHAVDADDRGTAVDVEPTLEAGASERRERFISRTLNITFCFCLNGMAWWPGNERDNVFATAKRRDQVKEQSRNSLNLEQGLIGAATLVEKNTRLDWAFATTENQHSIGDVAPIVHLLSMLINARDHRFHIGSGKTG